MKAKNFDKALWHCGLLAVLLLAMPGARAVAQLPEPGTAPQTSKPGSDPSIRQARQFADENRANEEQYSGNGQAEAQMRLRQVYLAQEVQMVKDSHKLVDLAAKLNAEVASQHGGALTPAELRELAQIEKLARSVRTKMEAPVPGNLFHTDPTNTNIYSPR